MQQLGISCPCLQFDEETVKCLFGFKGAFILNMIANDAGYSIFVPYVIVYKKYEPNTFMTNKKKPCKSGFPVICRCYHELCETFSVVIIKMLKYS